MESVRVDAEMESNSPRLSSFSRNVYNWSGLSLSLSNFKAPCKPMRIRSFR